MNTGKKGSAEIVNFNTIVSDDAMQELIRAALRGNIKKDQYFLATHLIRQAGSQMDGIPIGRLLNWANQMARQENKHASKQPRQK